jgi:hypothetical protein
VARVGDDRVVRCWWSLLLVCALARADSSTPVPAAPKCHDRAFRAIERAFADYCRGHKGGGIHGSCADWLHAYRECRSVDFERAAPGWNVVLRLFDCHDPVLTLIPDGKRWRVRAVSMRSYLPRPTVRGLEELVPSPSPRP